MTSLEEVTREEVICKYCKKPSTHKILKKLRYGKNDKKTYHNVCDNIRCHMQYPDSDVKLRRFQLLKHSDFHNLLLSCMIYFHSDNNHL